MNAGKDDKIGSCFVEMGDAPFCLLSRPNEPTQCSLSGGNTIFKDEKRNFEQSAIEYLISQENLQK
jgi:hypothetical protein